MSAALENLLEVPPSLLGGSGYLRSPLSGAMLHRDGPHSLAAAGERWPVIDGIAYLRLGRIGRVRATLQALDAGDLATATALLLQDRADDAEEDGPVSLEDLRALAMRRPVLGFREAMRGLGFGFAGEYFAHRWSDPTFLSGLALAEAHWPSPARVIEPACGTGHFLRAFARHAQVCGGDVVFATLWLARHWVAPSADLVCFDASQPWPFDDDAADLVFCHDALHLLADQDAAVAEMGRVAGQGAILCGRAWGLTRARAAALFGSAVFYDDVELTASLIARRAPRARPAEARFDRPALSVAAGSAATQPARPVLGTLSMPPRGAALRRNPLYCEEADGACVRRFPSQRYSDEIGRLATYPPRVTARGRVTAGADPADDALIRRRVWVDLPQRW